MKNKEKIRLFKDARKAFFFRMLFGPLAGISTSSGLCLYFNEAHKLPIDDIIVHLMSHWWVHKTKDIRDDDWKENTFHFKNAWQRMIACDLVIQDLKKLSDE